MPKHDILIFGTGGHACEVADIAVLCGYRPIMVGLTAQELKSIGTGDEAILEQDIGRYPRAARAIGIGETRLRQRIAKRHGEGANFPSLCHPDTSLGRGTSDRIQASRGTVIFAGARLTTRLTLGDFIVVNQNATIAHDCVIGDYVTIAPGAHLSGHVQVNSLAWIGSGCVVNQGVPGQPVVIGAGGLAGSGAVVLATTEAEGVYAGVPAKRIR
jgi:sugar O-acyltransferase (sialic acid O-acetyltransferase NeuD family)